ncbi:MFS transporter [Dysgonomonas gadei]|uniref:MFS transporter n=1 Tax=Dysgonomonas gadei TaxID=156974 RepID=UPI003AF12B6B
MTEILRQKLSDSKAARWTVLALVAFTMFCAYFITDVMAPLMEELGKEFNWTASDFGIFNFSYMWINVFFFMLIIGGMVLDKIGVRMTGVLSCATMLIGCFIKYYAVANPEMFVGTTLGLKTQLLVACIGYAIFAMGLEMAGITVTKTIARWFKGHEMALAMGLQVAVARIGTALALSAALPLAKHFNSLSTPILLGLVGLSIGLVSYLVFCVMDKKLEKSLDGTDKEESDEEAFNAKNILLVVKNKGFWLLAFMCVLFYSAVYPFLKYAVPLMTNKYNVEPEFAGSIPAMLPIGAIFLTPLFGGIFDRLGKGVTLMMIGALLLTVVHFLFSLPLLNIWWFATILMIFLGIAFSLVPSAMWPSVPKIIPQNQLGTAYGLIFWVQNIGLGGVPLLIGWVLNKYCIIGKNAAGATLYDFQLPMIIFTCFGVLALIVAFLLKREDKKKGYGLELPNIKK